MDINATDLALAVELHEAQGWSTCVDAASEYEGNPLRAEVDRSGNTPFSTLATFDFFAFNRVIALGVESPATERDLDQLISFYASREQTRFQVEVSPTTQPPELVTWLEFRGFVEAQGRSIKLWRPLGDVPAPHNDIEVRMLSSADRDIYAEVCVASWGLPRLFRKWFGATVGRDGFHHFGIFDGDKLVSASSIFVRDDLAWSAFGVTLSDYRGRHFQSARIAKQLEVATALGCRLMHTETAVGTPTAPTATLHNLIRFGFTPLYEKLIFAPALNDEL
jgi:hypothetical protein